MFTFICFLLIIELLIFFSFYSMLLCYIFTRIKHSNCFLFVKFFFRKIRKPNYVYKKKNILVERRSLKTNSSYLNVEYQRHYSNFFFKKRRKVYYKVNKRTPNVRVLRKRRNCVLRPMGSM